MGLFGQIKAKVRASYQSLHRVNTSLPHQLQVLQLVQLSMSYLEGASVLDQHVKDAPVLLHHPRVQLSGHALELALKAFLLAKTNEAAWGHDLESLAKQAEREGANFDDPHAGALILHLNHAYFKDLGNGDQYPARYGGGGAQIGVPHDRLARIIRSLCDQANAHNGPRDDRSAYGTSSSGS